MAQRDSSNELIGFLKKKESWYDPDELLCDANLLSSTQMRSSAIPDVEEHVIGSYYGTCYALDKRDGFAKPVEEFR